MLKYIERAQPFDLEQSASARLREVLRSVPFLKISQLAAQPKSVAGGWKPDLLLQARAGSEHWRLVCEVKAMAQPRHVRLAVLQLKNYVAKSGKSDDYPVIIAPYLSPDAAALCVEEGVGYADLAGNCRLQFGHVYVERSTGDKPPAQRRELRSIFASKSLRVVRALLREPGRVWKVVEIASEAQVSLGQVSNVRKSLLDREWAEEVDAGLRVKRSREILEAWRQAAAPRRASRSRFYCLMHGESLTSAIRDALAEAGNGRHAVLASFSAGSWIAPYARVSRHYFNADWEGESILSRRLKLEPALKGENIIIERPADDGVFLDRLQAAPGLWCTGLAQTYVDLAHGGERGEEAANHLYETKIAPAWGNAP